MSCWDTIVIGSGGITAAVAFARAGQRVIVVEQRYLPGGWTHSSSLDGYLFRPGVHYIGELGPGGSVRRLYEGLGLSGALEFRELNPDGFEEPEGAACGAAQPFEPLSAFSLFERKVSCTSGMTSGSSCVFRSNWSTS
jgi:phytoene dehydrogenase-like protein